MHDSSSSNNNNNINNNKRENRPSMPQFHLHTALCPWASKLLFPSITKPWLSLIILAIVLYKLLETAGRLHFSAKAYLLLSSTLTHLLFMAIFSLSMTSSKTSHHRTMLSLIFLDPEGQHETAGDHVKNESSLETFKSKLKTHLFKQSYNCH